MKNELSQIISQSRSLVFFGGAGVSTESGIPDFRSVDGLYNQKYDYPPAHKKLAELEEKGILSAVVTQNIDGLHQAAGSKNVFELHGSVLRNYCTRCGKSYDVDYMLKSEGVPHCSCGGIIKPDVVLYEEALDDRTVRGAVNAIASADTLIIAGTSMVVYPAAGLVNYFDGKHLVVINMSPTSADSRADLLICGKVGEVLGGVEI